MSHSEHEHNHAQCIADALNQAEQICADQGRRLTTLRRRVLELVWSSHRPIGAYSILDALSEGGRKAAPPTVYRALEFLIDAGLVHRLDSLNAFVGCSDPGHAHQGQFLICRNCRQVIELDTETVDSHIREAAAAAGFLAEQQTLEVQGLCADCHQPAEAADG
ncbi:MAG: Fur family transcriptional regulator [Pseudomonadota bacterium]